MYITDYFIKLLHNREIVNNTEAYTYYLEKYILNQKYKISDIKQLDQLIADQIQLALGKFEIFAENNLNKDDSVAYFQEKFVEYPFIRINKTNDAKIKFEFEDPVVSVTLRANQPKSWTNVGKTRFFILRNCLQ